MSFSKLICSIEVQYKNFFIENRVNDIYRLLHDFTKNTQLSIKSLQSVHFELIFAS